MRLLEHAAGVDEADPGWGLLVIEFRVHAARDPALARRYAAVHERTLAGMEVVITDLYPQAAGQPPLPPSHLARLLLAVGAGARLEQAVEPGSSPMTLVAGLLARLIAAPAGSTRQSPGGKAAAR